jgi:RNA polymerase sigma-70 factor (ECF subfamily)
VSKDDVGVTVDAAWRAGVNAFPGVVVDHARFAAHVREMDVRQIEAHGADLYLACACAARDLEALRWFEEHLLIPAARVAARSPSSTRDLTDAVTHRLRLALLAGERSSARFSSYAGRGPLRTWVGVIAIRTALALRRSVGR